MSRSDARSSDAPPQPPSVKIDSKSASDDDNDLCRKHREKGYLIFDSAFECGNLERVDYVSECEYDLYMRPDTNNTRHCVWFYFSVENAYAEQKVLFNIVNFSKSRSLYSEGMAPVVKSLSRPRWRRIPSEHAYFHRSSAHDNRLVISYSFSFDRKDDVYYFAYCFPYTYTQLHHHLISLEACRFDYFWRETLCETSHFKLSTNCTGIIHEFEVDNGMDHKGFESAKNSLSNNDTVASKQMSQMTIEEKKFNIMHQHPRVDLLTITKSSNLRSINKQRIIVITARIHSGETPASFVCQGLIDFLVSGHPIAAALRETFVFKIVPMLNPDGVYVGNGRCSLSGFDLNRHWQNPSVDAQPSILATKRLLIDFEEDPKMQVDFVIDMHSHSQLLNAFFYGNTFANDRRRFQRQLILPNLLAEIAEDYSMDFTQFNNDPAKAGTSRRVMASLTSALCYTLEVSVYGYCRKETPREIVPYTQEAYKRLGENLAHAFYHYLDVERGSRNVTMLPYGTQQPASSSTPSAVQSQLDNTNSTDDGADEAKSIHGSAEVKSINKHQRNVYPIKKPERKTSVKTIRPV